MFSTKTTYYECKKLREKLRRYAPTKGNQERKKREKRREKMREKRERSEKKEREKK